jgi:serine/threonine-protein kinase
MAEITLRGVNGIYVFDPHSTASLIAKGGMGIVYSGINLNTGKKVAVKVIYRELAQNPTNIERAREEAKVSIEHPNLLKMLDFVEEGGIYHVVSEFLEGQPLDQLLKFSGGLTVGRSLEITVGIVRGLHALHAHSTPIVHRDIKPSNVFICEDGTVKVMDFGIAKISGGKRRSLTGMGVVVGTPYYSAPEQIKSKSKSIGPWTDVYSTGITLYELIAGNPPFDGAGEFEVLKLQVEAPLPPNEKIPGELFRVLKKASEKDYEKRYKTASSFGNALLECGEKLKVAPNRKSSGAKTVAWKWAVIGLALIAIALLISTASWMGFYSQKDADYREAHSTKERLYRKIDGLENKQRNVSNQVLQLQNVSNAAKEDLTNMAKYYPFRVKKIEFGNVRSNGSLISDYGILLSHYSLQYLAPKVYYESYLDESKEIFLNVKIFDSDEKMFKAITRDQGYTLSKRKVAVESSGNSDSYFILQGFGTSNASTYSTGRYRYEIWCNGRCLGYSTVYIR